MARFDSAQRTKILEAAIPVFAEQGLEGTAIRSVGQAAGVNSAMLYYYFENKHTLFVEAVRLVMKGLMDHLAQRRRPFVDGRDRLAFLVDGIFDYYGDQPGRLRLMTVALILHAEILAEIIRGFVEEEVLLPLEVVQEGVKLRQLKPRHPAQVWWSILGMSIFSLKIRDVTQHMDPSTLPVPLPDIVQTRRQIIDLLCTGLAVPQAGPTGAGKRKRIRTQT
jgi:TetR/AcrR family transcriptional regulator